MMRTGWRFYCKRRSQDLRFWVSFVYAPQLDLYMPALFRPAVRQERLASLRAVRETFIGLITLATVDLHYRLTGRFDETARRIA